MSTRTQTDNAAEAPYVSTGHLPPPDVVKALVAEAYERSSRTRTDRTRRSTRPGAVPSDLFGICVVGTNGNVYAAGDADIRFTIMSVSKPFVFALVCEPAAEAAAKSRRELPPTWRSSSTPSNGAGGGAQSLLGIRPSLEESSGRDGRQPDGECGSDRDDQPGAGCERAEKWKFIHDGLSRFAGRKLPLNDEVYASASETNFRNQSIARLLQSFGRIYMDPAEASTCTPSNARSTSAPGTWR